MSSGAGGECELGEVKDRRHAFWEDPDSPPPTAAQRDACGRAVGSIWLLIGVVFLTVVIGLPPAAGIAAAFLAWEAAKLIRYAPVLGVAAGESV